MSATKKKPTSTTRAAKSAKPTAQDDARMIDHVAQVLEDAQKDLASIGGSLGAGAGDLRKDVQRMLRDARRDLDKLSKALQRDLQRLQKDLTKTPAKNGSSRAAAPATGKGRPKTRAATR